ncbi:uncharacterized protein LOC135389719 [Ornithodoros turicata]|uniref:uncharacterized protein LOC135389719 n=1 Tax=Ornithodoros turicata TaxID=34597 RepID=UPI003139C29D
MEIAGGEVWTEEDSFGDEACRPLLQRLMHIPENLATTDDTTIFVSSSDETSLISLANALLEKVRNWAKRNCFHINVSKTKAVIFRPKNKQVTMNLPLSYGDMKIQYVNDVKTVEVVFSYNLSWDGHVQYIRGRLCKVSGMIKKCRYLLPVGVKLLRYNSLFYSLLSYCILIWGTTTTSNENQIHMIQKRVLRIVLFYKTMTRTNNQHVSIIWMNQYRPTYPVRTAQKFRLPFSRTNYGKQSITYQLPILLNMLASIDIDIFALSDYNMKQLFIV